MKAKLYNQKGTAAGDIELPESVFDVKWNGDLVHQVLMSMLSNARVLIANTKGRSEVRGGGRKPWKQKGTGRARHGSRRSPLWRGGGITFGPTNLRDFTKKINKKMRVKALYTLLSEKLRNKEILFIDALEMSEIKSSNAKQILLDWSTVTGFEAMHNKRKNAVCIYLPEKNDIISRSFSNFGNVVIMDVHNMNPLDITKYKYIVMIAPEQALSFLEGKLHSGVEVKN